MTNYAVITKTYKDVPRTTENAALPDGWPAEVKEFVTLDEAQKACPGLPVMTIAEYRHFSQVLALANNFKPVLKKSWWNFWG